MQALQEAAYEHVEQAVCSDAAFLFSPQQIALAALHQAASRLQSPTGPQLDVSAWLQERFAFLPGHGGGGVPRLMAQLDRDPLFKDRVPKNEVLDSWCRAKSRHPVAMVHPPAEKYI